MELQQQEEKVAAMISNEANNVTNTAEHTAVQTIFFSVFINNIDDIKISEEVFYADRSLISLRWNWMNIALKDLK